MSNTVYTPEKVEWLRQNRAKYPIKELAIRFEQKFGDHVKPKTLETACKRRRILAGNTIWTDEMYQFIKDNRRNYPPAEFTVLLNNQFDTNVTRAQINDYCRHHKELLLHPYVPPTQEELVFLNTHSRKMTLPEYTAAYNQTFHTDYEPEQLRSRMRKLAADGLIDTPSGFGVHPKSYPEGTVVRDSVPQSAGSRQLQIKTSEGWKDLAATVWINANGPVPKGKIIHFIDGNPLNTDLSNLIPLTRSESEYINRSCPAARLGREYTEFAVYVWHALKRAEKRRKVHPEAFHASDYAGVRARSRLKWLHQKAVMHCGMEAEITDVLPHGWCIVTFADGTSVKRPISCFTERKIRHP